MAERTDESGLLPAERLMRIQEQVSAQGTVRVKVLARRLGVSEVTIRRDLLTMERRGVLERTRGGAVPAHRVLREPRYVDATAINAEEKRCIGAAAASLIEPGDTLFVSGGTTVLEVFRHISAADVRVITNNVSLALVDPLPDVELTLVGGVFRPGPLVVVGSFGLETLRHVYASKTFLGADGISARYGVTGPSQQETELARVMIERTRGEVIVVADHSKIGAVADFVIADLDQIDRLVTDTALSRDHSKAIAQRGVEVVIAASGDTDETRS